MIQISEYDALTRRVGVRSQTSDEMEDAGTSSRCG